MSFHFVFVDITYGYTASRPERDEPLGGMTSAICFLARELAQAGVQCSLVNRIEKQTEDSGILSYPLEALGPLCADPSLSAVIFCGRWSKEMAEAVRPLTRAPFIAWMHEACFEMMSSPPLDVFDAAVFVSLWQAKVNAPFVSLRWQQAIIRNAMNPRFVELFEKGEEILPSKQTPPLILYAGDYPRGAAHLLPVLNALRPRDPDFVFEAYTDACFTATPAVDQAALATLSQHPNVHHVGKVGQAALAQKLKSAAILLAPNLWPETSCINLIQAMASGILCLTTTRAALPESAHGYAHLIATPENDHLFRYDQPIDEALFAQTLATLLSLWRTQPDAIEARLQDQRTFFLAHYQWKTRVEPWLELVKRFT